MQHIEPHIFKGVLSRWASGVTIVTTCQSTTPIGMTASSFTSVSLQPPQVLVCIGYQALTHAAIAASGYFAVNLLAVEQFQWGLRFAGLIPEIADRFAGISYSTARTGAPILPGVVAWVDCQVRHAIDSGDHTIYIGDVVDGAVYSDAAPLLYYNRGWRQLEQGVLQVAG
jgi:flavin reductase (DIM6/NTAB) family NADH-FMN oxidoreductase RutF